MPSCSCFRHLRDLPLARVPNDLNGAQQVERLERLELPNQQVPLGLTLRQIPFLKASRRGAYARRRQMGEKIQRDDEPAVVKWNGQQQAHGCLARCGVAHEQRLTRNAVIKEDIRRELAR